MEGCTYTVPNLCTWLPFEDRGIVVYHTQVITIERLEVGRGRRSEGGHSFLAFPSFEFNKKKTFLT